MRVIVAGSRGYVGSVLVGALSAAGHQVTEIDAGYYEGCDFGAGPQTVATDPVDIRNIAAHHLRGAEAVVCLAATPDDQQVSLDPRLAQSVNLHGTLRLARVAKYAGVQRFLYLSSASLYVATPSRLLAEDAELRPTSALGAAKAAAESGLARLTDDTFSVTILRPGQIFGSSPRLRLDLGANRLLAKAVTTGSVAVDTGADVRSLVHVDDVAQTCLAVLQARREAVSSGVFHVGADANQLTGAQLAEVVGAAVPEATIISGPGATAAGNAYRLDYSRLHEAIPALPAFRTVADGLADLAAACVQHRLGGADLDTEAHVRMARLRQLVATGRLDPMLRPLAAQPDRGSLLPAGSAL